MSIFTVTNLSAGVFSCSAGVWQPGESKGRDYLDPILLKAVAAGKLGISPVISSTVLMPNITDSTGGTAATTLESTVGIVTVPITLQLASMTTSAADLMTNYTPGYAFELLSLEFITTTLGTGSGASQVLNLEIGTTNVTGGVLTLLLADTTPLGKKTAATAITANNIGTASDTISLEVAASGTVFTAGEGVALIKLRNLDTVNAIASLAAETNKLSNMVNSLQRKVFKTVD